MDQGLSPLAEVVRSDTSLAGGERSQCHETGRPCARGNLDDECHCHGSGSRCRRPDNASGLVWCNNLYHTQALRVVYRGRGQQCERVPGGQVPACVLLLRRGHSTLTKASSSSWRRRLHVVEALHRVAGKVRVPLGDSRPGHGNDAQLLQHAELVPADPVFAPQVVLEAADDDCSDLDGFSGGRDAH